MKFGSLAILFHLVVAATAEASNSTGDIITTNSSSSGVQVDPPTSLEECDEILESCLNVEDSVCNECYKANVGRETEFTECNDNYPFEMQPGMQPTCDTLIKDMCCRSHISEKYCLGDDAIMSHWECKLGYYGCSTEALSCKENPDAATNGDGSTSGATATKFRITRLPSLAGAVVLALTVAVGMGR